jgi:hypothetical protein
MVKFMKIDTRHENIRKIHATGVHQPMGFIILEFVVVKFMKIDTRHENIRKIHATGVHQPMGFIHIKVLKLQF